MSIPRLAAARADGSIFVFTVVVSILNGVLFGIAPALRTARRDPAPALQAATSRGIVGRQRNGLRSTLVIAEVAVAVVLVVIGGLLTASFVRLLRTDPGFDPDRVLASIVVATSDEYRNLDRRGELYRRILGSVRSLPDVEQAGTVDALPFSGENNGGEIGTSDSGGNQVAEIDRISSGYLPALGVRLVNGRSFREDDMESSRDTALVNEAAAKLLWPHESPLGKRFCINCSNPQTREWRQVVGVVKSILHSGLDETSRADVYTADGALEHAQFVVVRTAHPNPQLARSIRQAVAAIDPKQPVFLSATMSTLIGDSIADRRFIMTILAITGCLALALAAAGIFGVVSFVTSLRTQEIGVRMALGATPGNVHLLIFRQGMWMAGTGIGVGLAAALVLMRVLSSVLQGLASPDPWLVVIAAASVSITAAIASLIPAVRATKIDPMSALRE
jgi:predicted permease